MNHIQNVEKEHQTCKACRDSMTGWCKPHFEAYWLAVQQRTGRK